MRNMSKTTSVALATVVLAGLTACAAPQSSTQPQGAAYPTSNYPANTYPNAYPNTTYPSGSSVRAEYGRVSNVEVIQTQEPGRASGAGAVIGGIAGGVIGNQVGGGSGRDVARIAGIAGGALAGNAIEKNRNTTVTQTHRVTVQVDGGAYRSYDFSAVTDLRAGDRVRIENGQLFRL